MRAASEGFAYVEVLVAAVILVIALVPASDAMRAATRQSDYARSLMPQHYRALQALEITQARTFAELLAEANATAGNSPSKWSDAAGTTNRRVVYIARIDFDNADADDNVTTGVDDRVVRINVQVEGTPVSVFGVASNRS